MYSCYNVKCKKNTMYYVILILFLKNIILCSLQQHIYEKAVYHMHTYMLTHIHINVHIQRKKA